MQPKTLWYALAVALIVFASIVVVSLCTDEAEPEPAPTYELVLDCSNAAMMHAYGLPTKADVIQYHVQGRWGYLDNGAVVLFDDLPGNAESWDSLYQIKPNKAFRR